MFKEEFKDHLLKFNTSPFLFIGSGFSRRYLETDTWEDLLRAMVEKLNLPKPYDFYKSNSNSDLAKTASLIGVDFNSLWWESDKFKESRDEFSTQTKSKYSPIKYEVCRYIKEKNEIVNNEAIRKEINLLKKVNIDGIITTNWDTLCEDLFPSYSTFIGQEELIFSELFNIGEIYKIHGSVAKPNSLVLTEEDYIEFGNRNPYLAAKLLTQFIENPIIFIGYSLEDKNIQYILKSIVKCLTTENITKLQDRLIFCQWTSDEVETQISDSVINISETTLPIKLITLNNFIDLYTVLANNKRRFPIKVLRQMKGMVYDFVKSNQSKQKVYVADNLDDLENIHNAEFVYGFGIKNKLSEVGIKGLELKDVLMDVLKDNKWNSNAISKLSFPSLQTRARFIPYFKHLRNGGFLNDEGLINEESEIKEFSPAFIETVNNIKREDFYPAQTYVRKKMEINNRCKSIQEVIDNYDDDLHHLIYVPLLDDDKISLRQLRDLLKDKEQLIQKSKFGTHYRKLICLYDFLKYRKNNIG